MSVLRSELPKTRDCRKGAVVGDDSAVTEDGAADAVGCDCKKDTSCSWLSKRKAADKDGMGFFSEGGGRIISASLLIDDDIVMVLTPLCAKCPKDTPVEFRL